AVSLVVLLWSGNGGMKSVFDALNLVYNETEERGFFKLNLVSLTFTILAILLVLVAIGAMVVVPIVLDFLGWGGATEVLVKIARWPLCSSSWPSRSRSSTAMDQAVRRLSGGGLPWATSPAQTPGWRV